MSRTLSFKREKDDRKRFLKISLRATGLDVAATVIFGFAVVMLLALEKASALFEIFRI